MENNRPHITMVPSPRLDHVIPLLELAKLLVSRFHLTASLLIPTTAGAAVHVTPTAVLDSHLHRHLGRGGGAISFGFLPPVDPARIPGGTARDRALALVHLHSRRHLQAALSFLARRAWVAGLVADRCGIAALEVAREAGIPPYLFFGSSAAYLGHIFRSPSLDVAASFWTARHVRKFGLAEGILVNTFLDLESGPVRALQEEEGHSRPPVYPVGPIVGSGVEGVGEFGSDWVRWLDRQPNGSVLYVCLGSEETLSNEQLNEMVIELGRSGQRFLWAVNISPIASPSPNPGPSSSLNFDICHGSCMSSTTNDESYFNSISKRFATVTNDHGLIVPISWASKAEILTHKSIGGLLTHCEWNSVLESITYKLPLIIWPFSEEQKFNATMLEERRMVALRLNSDQTGRVIKANEIAEAVKKLTDDIGEKRIHEHMKKFQHCATKAMEDEDGSTSKALNQFVLRLITTKVHKL